MTGNLEKRSWQRFSSSITQYRVIAPLFLFFLNGPDKSTGDVPLCHRFDQGVAVLGGWTCLLFQLRDSSLKADENLFRFFADMGELSIGEVRHIGHKHLP